MATVIHIEPALSLALAPWDSEPTKPDNPTAKEIRRTEQSRQEAVRDEALALMASEHLATFAEALEAVRLRHDDGIPVRRG